MDNRIYIKRRLKKIETNKIINGDCLAVLRTMPAESVHCCVTSPPYYALRDYSMEGQIGREATPEQYIERLTEIFTEVYRVLKKDGTCWLNIADTYCGTGSKGGCLDPKNPKGRNGQKISIAQKVAGCKRNDIIWQKGNAMPESAKDRLTRSYEHIFLLAKAKKYFFDAKAIAEPIAEGTTKRYMAGRGKQHKYSEKVPGQGSIQKLNQPRRAGDIKKTDISPYRNCRDVWRIKICW